MTVQSQGSFAGPALPNGSNSGVKRNRKGARKLAENGNTTQNGHSKEVNTKYKDIDGVSDWFLAKKSEIEKLESVNGVGSGLGAYQKKSIYLSLPLNNHTWRPPRIDS